jgi:hypothetical protein
MSSVAFVEERVMFSPTMPAEVNNLLQADVAASSVDQSRAENLFLQAQMLDSHCFVPPVTTGPPRIFRALQ